MDTTQSTIICPDMAELQRCVVALEEKTLGQHGIEVIAASNSFHRRASFPPGFAEPTPTCKRFAPYSHGRCVELCVAIDADGTLLLATVRIQVQSLRDLSQWLSVAAEYAKVAATPAEAVDVKVLDELSIRDIPGIQEALAALPRSGSGPRYFLTRAVQQVLNRLKKQKAAADMLRAREEHQQQVSAKRLAVKEEVESLDDVEVGKLAKAKFAQVQHLGDAITLLLPVQTKDASPAVTGPKVFALPELLPLLSELSSDHSVVGPVDLEQMQELLEWVQDCPAAKKMKVKIATEAQLAKLAILPSIVSLVQHFAQLAKLIANAPTGAGQ